MIYKEDLARLTAEVVSSYVGKSTLTDSELDRATVQIPLLIERVHEALLRIIRDDEILGTAPERAEGETEDAVGKPASGEAKAGKAVRLSPAVPIDASVHDDYLVCLEDGRRFKTLKRHLAAKYGLTPEAYREKWSLPADYPMACKAYADSRSRIATRIGLGVGGRGSQPAHVTSSVRRQAKAR